MVLGYDFSNLASQVGVVALFIGGIVIILGCVGAAVFLYTKQKEYSKYKVHVWKRFKTEDGREMPVIVDDKERGKVIKDKKLKKWVFHLKKANLDLGEEELANYDEDRELDIPSVPHAKGGEVVFVEQLAKRKYAVGEPFVVGGEVKIRITQADQAEAMRAYDMNARAFGKQKNELIAFIIYIAFAVLILVLIIMVLNKFESISDFGDKWVEGAKILQETRMQAIPSDVPG